MRADSAGATHKLLEYCHDGQIGFSVGFDLTEPVRRAIVALPERAWQPAITQDGEPRDLQAAGIAEITDRLDLTGWPEGSRVLVRREIPHPGAQFSFTDHDGHRFQAILTDQADPDIAYLEARHRGHARVEDRIRTGKDTGPGHLPSRHTHINNVWVELALIAADLLALSQTMLLTDQVALAKAEPKTLRYRLLHIAARITRGQTPRVPAPRRALAMGARPRESVHPPPVHPAPDLTAPPQPPPSAPRRSRRHRTSAGTPRCPSARPHTSKINNIDQGAY
jgi:hypothetical protein